MRMHSLKAKVTTRLVPTSAAIAASGLVVALGVAVDTSPVEASTTSTVTFSTSGTSKWSVPTDVCKATFDVRGGQGGSGGPAQDTWAATAVSGARSRQPPT